MKKRTLVPDPLPPSVLSVRFHKCDNCEQPLTQIIISFCRINITLYLTCSPWSCNLFVSKLTLLSIPFSPENILFCLVHMVDHVLDNNCFFQFYTDKLWSILHYDVIHFFLADIDEIETCTFATFERDTPSSWYVGTIKNCTDYQLIVFLVSIILTQSMHFVFNEVHYSIRQTGIRNVSVGYSGYLVSPRHCHLFLIKVFVSLQGFCACHSPTKICPTFVYDSFRLCPSSIRFLPSITSVIELSAWSAVGQR